MNIKPLYDRIIVKTVEAVEKTSGGIVLPDTAKEKPQEGEVLAVGDVGFKAKCYNAIDKISKRAAVILVSHSMPAVARMCNSTCLMKNGKNYFMAMMFQKELNIIILFLRQKPELLLAAEGQKFMILSWKAMGKKGYSKLITLMHC